MISPIKNELMLRQFNQSPKLLQQIMINLKTVLIAFVFSSIIEVIICQSSSINVTLQTYNPSTSYPMIINSSIKEQFIFNNAPFDCSSSPLFSYKQNSYQYDNNIPVQISITGFTTQMNISMSTKYGTLTPTIFQNTCLPPTCNINITNNCQYDLDFRNYFDIIQLQLWSSNFNTTISYNVLCLQGFSTNTLEFGLIVEIFLVSIFVFVIALYSRAWSLSGLGIEVNIWLIIIFCVLLLAGGILGYFSPYGINICLIILSFILGILGLAISFNELIFLFKIKLLRTQIFSIKSFQFRIMQGISLCIGVGITVGWWYSNKNIILNDIVCIGMLIGLIKILKFTSLKLAGLIFLIVIVIELVVVIVIYELGQQSYNNLFLNSFNYPLELQFPSINAVYDQKCAWLPVTSIIFPGMLLSYLRRFDSSRNTNVYLITSSILFLVGGLAWIFVNIPSPFTIPFGLISQPCMFGLVCIFSYRRREIRVLWQGKFYDEQFADQQDIKFTIQMIEQRQRGSTISKELIKELKNLDGASRFSDQTDVIRSKFLGYK